MEPNNKIIAKFLGWKLGHPDLFELRWSNEWFDGRDKKTTNGYLHFDSDWNWLMKVVKECYSKNHNQNSYYEAIYYALADLEIQAVYNACFEFIKWYNEQQK